MEADGTCHTAGSAPYLDLRPADDDEQELIRPYAQEVLGDDRASIEEEALAKVVDTSARSHLEEIRATVLPRLERVRHEVQLRLTNEIKFWEERTRALEEQALAGKQPKMNPARARERTEELIGRLNRRMRQLQAESQLTSTAPVLVAISLVVPQGLLDRLAGGPRATLADGGATSTWGELTAAERRVVEFERSQGNTVDSARDDGRGGTIRSTTPSGELRLIAVVERPSDGDVVRIPRTRLLTALNAPELFTLALVDHSAPTAVRYAASPFAGVRLPRLTETAVALSWNHLWKNSLTK